MTGLFRVSYKKSWIFFAAGRLTREFARDCIAKRAGSIPVFGYDFNGGAKEGRWQQQLW